jgi:hypothetical protein
MAGGPIEPLVLAAGHQAVMCDGVLGIFDEKYIRAI